MRLAVLPAVLAALLCLKAEAQELDATFKPIAEAFARDLANRGIGSSDAKTRVPVYLPPARSPYGVACEPLGGTLRRALGNALTPALALAQRNKVEILQRQALEDGALALSLIWTRYDERIEVSAAYGRIRGKRLPEAGLRSVSVPLDALPPGSRGCLRPLEANTDDLFRQAERTFELRRDIGGAGPLGRIVLVRSGSEYLLHGWLGGPGPEIAVVELLSDNRLEETLGYARLARREAVAEPGDVPPAPKPKPDIQVAVGLEPEPDTERYPDLSVFRDPLARGGQGPQMVVVPSGRLWMGSPRNEEGRDDDEGPQRQVTIQRFALSRMEVTVGDFRRFVEATSHKTEGGCWFYTGSKWERDAERDWTDPGFA